MTEDKRERFARLAEARTDKIIGTIRLLGNLSNPYHYEFTQEEVDAMFNAIQNELEKQKRKFKPRTNSKTRKLRL